jgi:RHS repeat-associated protein
LDDRNFPVREVDALGGTTAFEYDEVGRTKTVVDPGGLRTEYRYDDRGNLIRLVRPDGSIIITEFDDNDQAIAITDANGHTWHQDWNGHGSVVRQVTPLGGELRYEYNDRGQLSGITTPKGTHSKLFFDEYDSLVRVVDALGRTTEFAYDIFGNLTSKTDGSGQTERYLYDLKGRLTQAILPSGVTIECGYDGESNLSYYQDENGGIMRLEYCGLGEIRRRLQPDGSAVEYQYDNEERLIAVTNQRGERYELKRDPLGRIIEEVDYWGQARKYAYNGSGHLQESSDALGRVIRYQTDALGRILTKVIDTGDVETFAYDGNGNVITCANSAVCIKRTFDPHGRLLLECQGEECSVASSFDLDGNRISRTFELNINGRTYRNSVRYTYDALDQAVRVDAGIDSVLQITRNSIGQITQEILGASVRRLRAYNPDGYLTSQNVLRSEGPLFEQNYTYDNVGNLLEKDDSYVGKLRHAYDPLGRLIGHVKPDGRIDSYVADAAGDRLATRIILTPGNGGSRRQWSREGDFDGVRYRFDRVGNLVERAGRGGVTELKWDANQRLTESRTNGQVTVYRYDPLGRRISKETGGVITRFMWDEDTLLADVQPIDVLAQQPPLPTVREWIYYPETFEPIAVVQTGAAPEFKDFGSVARAVDFYHNDPNGCPTRLLDRSGNIVWDAQFGAWGAVTYVAVHSVDNPLRLQGQYCDTETGLHYNRSRYYDPVVGIFITQDPLGFAAGINLYEFAPNVWGWIDPLGLTCRTPRSKFPIGLRRQFNTMKEARQAAERASPIGEAVKHTGHGRPHFHPAYRTPGGKLKPLNHDHYFFPWRKG